MFALAPSSVFSCFSFGIFQFLTHFNAVLCLLTFVFINHDPDFIMACAIREGEGGFVGIFAGTPAVRAARVIILQQEI